MGILFCFVSRPLATSFTGKYGNIQYCVKATLERPMVPDQTVKREFQVISHIDVNSPVLLVRADLAVLYVLLTLSYNQVCDILVCNFADFSNACKLPSKLPL